MATRQTSSSGKPKSPRIQVVLPDELCERLAALAEQESRTVSNMAKVLIQQGVQRFEQGAPQAPVVQARPRDSAQIRSELEAQPARRLRGVAHRCEPNKKALRWAERDDERPLARKFEKSLRVVQGVPAVAELGGKDPP